MRYEKVGFQTQEEHNSMLSVMNDTKRRRDNYVNRLCEVQNTIFVLA